MLPGTKQERSACWYIVKCSAEMRTIMRKISKFCLLAMLVLSLSACGKEDKKESGSLTQEQMDAKTNSADGETAADTGETGTATDENTDSADDGKDEPAESKKPKGDYKYEISKAKKEVQNEKYGKKETLAIMHVKDYGDITFKFFPESAPKAVENFITHAAEGYYDGLKFHRVINDFMIQGGDPNGVGSGGESIWGDTFEDEFSDNLAPIRGSLCMANAGANTNGSQFFIVQASETYEKDFDAYFADYEISDKQKELLIKYGGTPWLSNQHTVFGQVVEGMDIVDTIAATQTDANDMPTADVIIESIEVVNPKK